MDIQAKNRAALEAIVDSVTSSLVGIMVGVPGAQPCWNGSGTLLRVCSDRYVVLTAAHVAQRDSNDAIKNEWHLLRRGLDDVLTDFAEETFVHPAANCAPPDDIDVAIMLVRRKYNAALSAYEPRSIADVADPSDNQVSGNQILVAAGYPWEQKKFDPMEARSLHSTYHSFPKLRPGCGSDGHPPRGLHMDWGDGAFDLVSEKPHVRPYPSGISGGPVWRLSNEKVEGLWAPTVLAKLVGVLVAYFKPNNCQRAESVADWGAWFNDMVTRHA
jgi:hypothetical protein